MVNKDLFNRFNRTNLVKEISKTVQIERKILTNGVKEYIWPRLDFLHGKSRKSPIYYIFEDNYTETEWKDMISVHYINTSYKVQNTVMRIHLFTKPELKSEYYIGFFTLRKIAEIRIMLSYIYPNWSKIFYQGQRLCVMTYKKRVHIMGEELFFNTYPLFVQDNITVACSHVSMISMTSYLHEKYDYSKIRILNLNDSFSIGKTKLFPTLGLTPPQMIEVFNTYNIPIGYYPMNANANDKAIYEKCHEYIDYTVESGIPVLLGMQVEDENKKRQRHVIQIIGHAQQNRYEYVVYDDSGYFLSNALEKEGFVSVVDWKMLKEYISSTKSFILYPIHEKVYLMYDGFKQSFEQLCEVTKPLMKLSEDGLVDKSNIRFLLADNRDIKNFLKNNVLKDVMENEIKNEGYSLQKEEIQKILQCNMPHYVWLCELPIMGGYFFFLADSTYGAKAIKNIFFNQIPIFSKGQFGLLNYN